MSENKEIIPESSYNFLRACGEPPIGASPRRSTPSMSNAMPNVGLQKQPHESQTESPQVSSNCGKIEFTEREMKEEECV